MRGSLTAVTGANQETHAMDDFFNPLCFFLGTLTGILGLFALLMGWSYWDDWQLRRAPESGPQSGRAAPAERGCW